LKFNNVMYYDLADLISDVEPTVNGTNF